MTGVDFLKSSFFFLIAVNCCLLLACVEAADKAALPLTTPSQTVSPTPNPTKTPSNQTEVRKDRRAFPNWLKCPRDYVTSFEGKVVFFEHEDKSVLIRMETDEETKEEFAVPYSEQDGQIDTFRLKGESFKTSDWKTIEADKGKLKADMRAVVWGCYDEKNNLTVKAIDWQPPSRK
jgi:hypothetical protein